jgi:hypothetical protein
MQPALEGDLMHLAHWTLSSLLLFAAACSAHSAPTASPQPPEGTLIVAWTLGGTTEPNRCSEALVDTIQIRVTRGDGSFAGVFEQLCTAFATSIPLEEGRYSAVATPVDVDKGARATSVAINMFAVHGDELLRAPIDFPTAAFE